MKHPQFILAADAKVFDTPELNPTGITSVDAEIFFENILGHCVIRRRDELDNADNSMPYRQFLPYDVFSRFTREFKRKYFAFRRKPKSGESELHGKVSIAIGGHVDGPNIVWAEDGSVDLPATLTKSSMIERIEELDIFIINADGTETLVSDEQKAEIFTKWAPRAISQVNILLFNDNVSLRHFALINNNIVPEGYNISISAAELELLEPLGFLSYEELTATTESGASVYQLEGWSKICLEHFNNSVNSGAKGLTFSGPIDGMQTSELAQGDDSGTTLTADIATSNIGQRIGHARKITPQDGGDQAALATAVEGVDLDMPNPELAAQAEAGKQADGWLKHDPCLGVDVTEVASYVTTPKSE